VEEGENLAETPQASMHIRKQVKTPKKEKKTGG